MTLFLNLLGLGVLAVLIELCIAFALALRSTGTGVRFNGDGGDVLPQEPQICIGCQQASARVQTGEQYVVCHICRCTWISQDVARLAGGLSKPKEN